MNKLLILILFALFYYAFCSGECTGVINPNSAEECLNTSTGESDNMCCYFLHEETNIRVCVEIPMNVNIEEYIRQYLPQYKPYYYTCLSSFLRTSMLLLAALILF